MPTARSDEVVGSSVLVTAEKRIQAMEHALRADLLN